MGIAVRIRKPFIVTNLQPVRWHTYHFSSVHYGSEGPSFVFLLSFPPELSAANTAHSFFCIELAFFHPTTVL